MIPVDDAALMQELTMFGIVVTIAATGVFLGLISMVFGLLNTKKTKREAFRLAIATCAIGILLCLAAATGALSGIGAYMFFPAGCFWCWGFPPCYWGCWRLRSTFRTRRITPGSRAACHSDSRRYASWNKLAGPR